MSLPTSHSGRFGRLEAVQGQTGCGFQPAGRAQALTYLLAGLNVYYADKLRPRQTCVAN